MSCTFRPDHSWNDHGVCLICGARTTEHVYVRGQWVDISEDPDPAEVQRQSVDNFIGRVVEAHAQPDLARARAASEAVTIQALRDEINVLRAELAKEKASNPGRYIPESQISYPQLEDDGA